MIALARKTLIHEWKRFVPVVLSVGFTGLMLATQAALVLGIFGTAALYVRESSGHIWAGYPGTQSVNFGRSVSADAEVWLRMDPDVVAVEPYQWVDGDWTPESPGLGSVSVYLSGISTDREAMLFSRLLPPELRARLREPGAVIVDSADLDSLGVSVGGRAWINRYAVRVVATLPGLRGLGGVNVLASLETATAIAPQQANQGKTYYVARLADSSRIQAAYARLAKVGSSFGPLQVWTAREFAQRSQRYWLLDTGAGTAVMFMALIVCIVGVVITSQSFSAVVAASAREYATLNALGASRYALSRVVIEQACLVGGLGLLIAAIASALLLAAAAAYHVPVAMTPTAALACIVMIGLMALLSSLMAIRALFRTDPSLLLR
ncbi:ABC transporter permease [Achromobacter deleyi]|uniref:ABC transporter permease n=1 Tax=Achromobacter deleyi TaxID=1353891 RepID=A0A7T4B7V3_9BURK|nr:ABC transporter permease [Achromobacter deleyi]QQB37197.1 ABC transporter permease [Achromobacter deleyi]